MTGAAEVLRDIQRGCRDGWHVVRTDPEKWPAALDSAIQALERPSYVPQDIAMELIAILAPLDVRGEPNTIWALTKKAMATIAARDAEVATLKARAAELSRCANCKEPLESNLCEECS